MNNRPLQPKQKLSEVLPFEFLGGEYDTCKAYKFKDNYVTEKHDENWIGNEKNVYSSWYVLDNGYAVAFNENPSRGWSFPTIKYYSED